MTAFPYLAEEESTINRDLRTQQTKSDEVARVKIKKNRLERELLATRFSAKVLDALRTSVPPSIAVEQFRLVRTPVDGALGIEVEIEGRADNSDRKALEHMDSLELAMTNLPGVARTNLVPDDLDRGFRSFLLVVSPDREPPARKKTRGGRPKKARR